MIINILYPFKNAWKYINEIEGSNINCEEAWQKHLIEPYWDKISEWAPGALDFMQPKPIKDLESLKLQLKILDSIDFNNLINEFNTIVNVLPKNDDDPITVAIYPLDNNEKVVKEKQNGVIGCCVAGNIVININPLANNFIDLIPYVFAHEYHHSVWGHNWFVIKGGLKGTLLEYMLNEGQADAFATSLYPNLKPSWLNIPSIEVEKTAWEKFQIVLNSTDRHIHNNYMFGNKELEMPWCIGYYFGNKIINNYLHKNKDISFKELIDIHPDEIFRICENK